MDEIAYIKEFVDLISKAKGNQKATLFLQESLKENFNIILEVLKFQFDKRITSGISKKSLNNEYSETPHIFFDSFIDVLNYLKENNTGSNQIIVNIKQYINSQKEEYRELLNNIVIQNLKIGLTAKTINKLLGEGTIYNWTIQGGVPREKLKLKNGEVFALQQKLNGVRATYHNGDLMGRSGNKHKGFNILIKQIEDVFGLDNTVDGELIRINFDNLPDNENFRKTLSIVNSDKEIPEKNEIAFVVYDVVPTSEFNSGEFTMPYISQRIDFIQSFKSKLPLSDNNIGILPVDYIGSDINEIEKRLAEYDNRGLEGMMLYRDRPYKRDKHNGLIKIKSFKFSDLRIVDWYEGDTKGKWKDKFGGFIVEYKGNTVKVGGGYTDEQREHFLLHADEYIGKIAEVKYKEESKDSKTGLYSIQFPVYMRIRLDKNEPSYE